MAKDGWQGYHVMKYQVRSRRGRIWDADYFKSKKDAEKYIKFTKGLHHAGMQLGYVGKKGFYISRPLPLKKPHNIFISKKKGRK